MEPEVYYLEVISGKDEKLQIKVTKTPEIMAVYRSISIYDEKGNLHIVFWKIKSSVVG